MRQLPLFESSVPRPEPRPADPAFVRKHLQRLLRIAQAAERLPWSEAETRSWEKLFPELTGSLPPEEGADLLAAFSAELARLRAA